MAGSEHSFGRWTGRNPTWGAPRIHGELLELGIQVADSKVFKDLPRRRKPPAWVIDGKIDMTNSKSNGNKRYRTEIVVAIIGLVGVLGGALIANWDKVFRDAPPPTGGDESFVSPDPRLPKLT